jgi:hypothetical protein
VVGARVIWPFHWIAGGRIVNTMGLAGHEVPTVFVQGHAPPAAVRDAETRLQRLCQPLRAVRYSVLWVRAAPDRYTVGVELDVEEGAIEVDVTAATMQAATDACMERLAAGLSARVVSVTR